MVSSPGKVRGRGLAPPPNPAMLQESKKAESPDRAKTAPRMRGGRFPRGEEREIGVKFEHAKGTILEAVRGYRRISEQQEEVGTYASRELDIILSEIAQIRATMHQKGTDLTHKEILSLVHIALITLGYPTSERNLGLGMTIPLTGEGDQGTVALIEISENKAENRLEFQTVIYRTAETKTGELEHSSYQPITENWENYLKRAKEIDYKSQAFNKCPAMGRIQRMLGKLDIRNQGDHLRPKTQDFRTLPAN